MAARTDQQPGLGADGAEVFYHDGDLRIEAEVSTHVEQVAGDDDEIMVPGLLHDPVELL